MKNCKLQRKKVQWQFWRKERKRTACSAWHTPFGHRFCLCCAWLQVRPASSGSSVTYVKECFKVVAAPTLLRPCLQAGGEEAAPAWAERAVGSVRSAASLQDFLLHYGNIPGHVQVQSGCHRTFFNTGFMGFSFLVMTGIHRKYSPPASLLPILYVLLFPTLIVHISQCQKKQKEHRILHKWFILINTQSTLTGITKLHKNALLSSLFCSTPWILQYKQNPTTTWKVENGLIF